MSGMEKGDRRLRVESRPPMESSRRIGHHCFLSNVTFGIFSDHELDTTPCSAAGHALRVHVERIDRGARGHEEAIAVGAAEADVGAALGQVNAPDELGFAV